MEMTITMIILMLTTMMIKMLKKRRRKGSRNRRNDKKCLELGEIDKIHVLPFPFLEIGEKEKCLETGYSIFIFLA